MGKVVSAISHNLMAIWCPSLPHPPLLRNEEYGAGAIFLQVAGRFPRKVTILELTLDFELT